MQRLRIFLRLPFSTTPIRVLTVNIRLRNLGRIQFIANLHLYTQKSACATSTRPLGEVVGKSPLQLSSRTIFAKLKIKQLLRKKVGY